MLATIHPTGAPDASKAPDGTLFADAEQTLRKLRSMPRAEVVNVLGTLPDLHGSGHVEQLATLLLQMSEGELAAVVREMPRPAAESLAEITRGTAR